jgi:hypothetical protein
VWGQQDRKERNVLFHNQWQVGNFLAQKQLKAGGQGAFKLRKSFFWMWLWMTATPLVGCWPLPKAKVSKGSNQRHP